MTHLRCIEDYRTYLVECYKQVKPPCVLDWPPQDKLQYVIPTLLTTEQPFLSQPTVVNIQYRKIKPADIFAFSKERGKNLIVLLGSPSGGKSTLAWFISRGWARGQLYQEYRLLVYTFLFSHSPFFSHMHCPLHSLALTLPLVHRLLLHPLPLTLPCAHSHPPLTGSEWRGRVCEREGEREWVEEETVCESKGEWRGRVCEREGERE